MKILFTVTNDLTYDQRMIRICTSLANAGYQVELVGRELKDSLPLKQQPFQQKRLKCFFTKGPFFYGEFNLRLYFYLLSKKMDAICAIDLDTILPCYFVSKRKSIKRVYDAHELFCEMKEIVSRRGIYKKWKRIEKFAVPKFKKGYTVNQPIADEFKKMYSVNYEVIRSVAMLRDLPHVKGGKPYLIYQGAVNEGRSFETLIPAMKEISIQLWICGDGNFMPQAKQLVKDNDLGEKVIFKGKIPPGELAGITAQAQLGFTLFDDTGLSNYYSLANRFFDYIHAGIPQVCVSYPAYRELNDQYHIAVLIEDLAPSMIAKQVNQLLNDPGRYQQLKTNCLRARQTLNWQHEEQKLLKFYEDLFKQ